jgi:hypothetical protein
MEQAVGETPEAGVRLAFDRRLKLEFHGSQITSDGGLLPFRELDDALGLSVMAGEVLTDPRTGANGRHSLVGQFRQSVFGRLAGYDDIKDADLLAHDPAMRWVVGGAAVAGPDRQSSQLFSDLALPWAIERWSLTSLRERVVKIGAKVSAHARYTIFQIAEVAVPLQIFQEILWLIARLRASPWPA